MILEFSCFLSDEKGNCSIKKELCIVNTDKYNPEKSILQQCETMKEQINGNTPELNKAISKNIRIE